MSDLISYAMCAVTTNLFSPHPQKGTKAPQAAGKIHTDFEKGFIMAEVFTVSASTLYCALQSGLYLEVGRAPPPPLLKIASTLYCWVLSRGGESPPYTKLPLHYTVHYSLGSI